jgi:hypothetical protein
MALIAMAIPIPAEKKQQFDQFAKELQGSRRAEFQQSRASLGVHERTFVQKTPMGDFVIVTLEGENPERAFEAFARDSSPFAQWMKDRVKEIHGMDFSKPMPPMPALLIDSRA